MQVLDGKVLDVLTGGARGEMEAQPVVSYNLVLSETLGPQPAGEVVLWEVVGTSWSWPGASLPFLRKENALVTQWSLPYS